MGSESMNKTSNGAHVIPSMTVIRKVKGGAYTFRIEIESSTGTISLGPLTRTELEEVMLRMNQVLVGFLREDSK
jgi:hypothetical protein